VEQIKNHSLLNYTILKIQNPKLHEFGILDFFLSHFCHYDEGEITHETPHLKVSILDE